MAERAYRIGVEKQELVVRVRRDALEPEDISRFLDCLIIESVRRRSELRVTDPAALADEIDPACGRAVG
jgi:hypothetical protein